MITDILDILKTNEFYGAGKCTEIAKGKHEFVTTWKDARRKMKRIIKAKR